MKVEYFDLIIKTVFLNISVLKVILKFLQNCFGNNVTLWQQNQSKAARETKDKEEYFATCRLLFNPEDCRIVSGSICLSFAGILSRRDVMHDLFSDDVATRRQHIVRIKHDELHFVSGGTFITWRGSRENVHMRIRMYIWK